MLIKVYNDGDYVSLSLGIIVKKTGDYSKKRENIAVVSITWSGFKCFRIVVTQLTPNSACPQ